MHGGTYEAPLHGQRARAECRHLGAGAGATGAAVMKNREFWLSDRFSRLDTIVVASGAAAMGDDNWVGGLVILVIGALISSWLQATYSEPRQ